MAALPALPNLDQKPISGKSRWSRTQDVVCL